MNLIVVKNKNSKNQLRKKRLNLQQLIQVFQNILKNPNHK